MPHGWRKALRDHNSIGRKFWSGGSTYSFCRCSSCARSRARAKHGEEERFGKTWAERSANLDYVQYVQRQGAKKQLFARDHVRLRRALREEACQVLLESHGLCECGAALGTCKEWWPCQVRRDCYAVGPCECGAAFGTCVECDGEEMAGRRELLESAATDPCARGGRAVYCARGGEEAYGYDRWPYTWRRYAPRSPRIAYDSPLVHTVRDARRVAMATAVAAAIAADPRPMAERAEPPEWPPPAELGLWAGRVCGALRPLAERQSAVEREWYRRLWCEQFDIQWEQMRFRQRQAARRAISQGQAAAPTVTSEPAAEPEQQQGGWAGSCSAGSSSESEWEELDDAEACAEREAAVQVQDSEEFVLVEHEATRCTVQ